MKGRKVARVSTLLSAGEPDALRLRHPAELGDLLKRIAGLCNWLFKPHHAGRCDPREDVASLSASKPRVAIDLDRARTLQFPDDGIDAREPGFYGLFPQRLIASIRRDVIERCELYRAITIANRQCRTVGEFVRCPRQRPAVDICVTRHRITVGTAEQRMDRPAETLSLTIQPGLLQCRSNHPPDHAVYHLAYGRQPVG